MMERRTGVVWIAWTTLFVCSITAEASSQALTRKRTWFVDAGACMGQEGGSPANPFCRIQDALVASADGDVISVAPGLYLENLDYLGKDVSVVSQAGPETTIVDGGGVAPVVRFVAGEGPGACLTGFTLRGGMGVGMVNTPVAGGVRIFQASPSIVDNVICDNSTTQQGGGISIHLGHPRIARNRIVHNESGEHGGGITVTGAGSSPVIEGNVIAENSRSGISVWGGSTPSILSNTIEDNTTGSGGGAGIRVYGSSPNIRSSRIVGNHAMFGGRGGGLHISGAAQAQVVGNVIASNQATETGGIYLFASGAPIIRRNFILDNTASSGRGGGISTVNESNVTIEGNLFVGNTVGGGGGAIGFLIGSSNDLIIRNNTMVDNHGGLASGIFMDGAPGSTVVASNIIVSSDDTAGIACDFDPFFTPVLVNNNVHVPFGVAYDGCDDPTGSAGNISMDPEFVDADARDYRLSCASPCIDAGDGDAGTAMLDLEGDPRVVDGTNTGVPNVDMGADEFSLLWIVREDDVASESAGSFSRRVSFEVQGPPQLQGHSAHVIVSLGDGSESGGIALPGTEARLGLSKDALFSAWIELSQDLSSVELDGCPGSATATTPVRFLSSFAAPGVPIYYAGFARDAEGITVSVTPTRNFSLDGSGNAAQTTPN